jgi:arsenite-transporting ATPase
MEPSVAELVASESIKWVFVGGKGGVGKTTTSCSIALQFAQARERVLLVSTDPAHNLSDAFGQKFGSTPTAVTSVPNLFCLEVDSDAALKDMQSKAAERATAMAAEAPSGNSQMGGMMQSMLGSGGIASASSSIASVLQSIPGIDETLSFIQMIGLVRSMDYDVVVFDTAPTGHTLRLLALPDSVTKGLDAATKLKDQFGPILAMARGMMGSAGGPGGEDPIAAITKQMEALKTAMEEVKATLSDPDRCTFVCVCIPEFLSLYETERLVQQLGKHDIDVANIVVNQVLWPTPAGTIDPCKACAARRRIQGKYLAQIDDLYEDFHVVKMPIMTEEVRGPAHLLGFSKMLVKPYDPTADAAET